MPDKNISSKSEKNCETESTKQNQKIITTETVGSPTLTEGLYL